MSRTSNSFVLIFPLLAASGCAHYQLPLSPLETPEVIGEGRGPKLEVLGVRTGVDLDSPASEPSEPGGQPTLASTVRPFAGARASLNPRIDIGARLSPHAPLTLLGKWQFSGGDVTTPGLAASVVAGAGILRGTAAGESVTYLGGSLSVPVGYRLESIRHQIVATPFLGVASISGVGRATSIGPTATAATTASPAGESSISATAYGASLGYSYRMQELLDLTIEMGYAMGSSGNASIPALQFGALMAYEL